jgi:ATP-dependent Lon protease
LKLELGLKKLEVDFTEDGLLEIIRSYTREAGVRELERQLGNVLRKSVVKIAEGKRLRKLSFSKSKIAKLLGAPKFTDTNIKSSPTIGYSVGLAWTELGGEVLPVEVVPMKGKSKLTLTGSLGDVMRESAFAALSYIRKNAQMFGLKDNFYEDIELHVHIPEGAVPKDGPSAGVTLTTALLSSLTDLPVRTDIAMTGEITLIGDVLPVGGLNEKLLAAKRLGLTEIIVPDKNRKDIGELPKELLDGLTIHYAKEIKDVLNLALTETPFVKKRVSRTFRNSARL